mgnify:CR=1 FL=1
MTKLVAAFFCVRPIRLTFCRMQVFVDIPLRLIIIEFATVDSSTYKVVHMQFSKLSMLIKLGREFGHEQIRDAGFSDTEHAICTFLCFHDQVSQDMIANALLLDKTTVAKALNAMESKMLVVREQDGQNRRKNRIRITETGKSSVSASMHIYDTWFTDVCACLSESELRQMDESIDKLIHAALLLREQDKPQAK